MGFSVSAGTAIILVGLFIAMGVLIPGMMNAHDRVTAAEAESDQLRMDRAATAVTITELNATDDGVSVQVLNDGTTVLRLSRTSLVVDNRLVTPDNATILGSNDDTDLWVPGETAIFELTVDSPDNVLVITQHGVMDRASIEEAEE